MSETLGKVMMGISGVMGLTLFIVYAVIPLLLILETEELVFMTVLILTLSLFIIGLTLIGEEDKEEEET